MTIEPKMSWLWVVVIPCVIAGSIWWYMSTALERQVRKDLRQYKTRNEEMRLVWERQDLDMKLYYQRQELTKINEKIRSEQKVAVPVGPAPPILNPMMGAPEQ